MTDLNNQNYPDLSGQPTNSQPASGQPYYNAPQQPGYGQQPPQQPQPGYNPQYAQQPPYTDPNQPYNSQQPGYGQPPYNGQPFQQTINIQTPAPSGPPKSKMAAGLLGIFLGAFGVHNFYLGYTGKAVAQLLITVLTCFIGAIVSEIWGLIEGIMILSGSITVDGHGVPLAE